MPRAFNDPRPLTGDHYLYLFVPPLVPLLGMVLLPHLLNRLPQNVLPPLPTENPFSTSTVVVQCAGDFTIRVVDTLFYMYEDDVEGDDNAREERMNNASTEALTKKFCESTVIGLAEGIGDGKLDIQEVLTSLTTAGLIIMMDTLTAPVPTEKK